MYGGSILTCAALKAVLWVPVIAASAAGGGIFGALAFICTMGNKEAAKKGFKFGANIVGGSIGLAVTLVAASLVLVKGPLHLVGMLGACLLKVRGLPEEDKEKHKQRNLTLFASLYQTIGDSYALWVLGGDSPFNEMRQKENAPKDLQTLLDIGANIYGENIFDKTTNNFELIMRLNYDPEKRKKYDKEDPEKIYTEMLGKSHEEFLSDLKSKFS